MAFHFGGIPSDERLKEPLLIAIPVVERLVCGARLFGDALHGRTDVALCLQHLVGRCLDLLLADGAVLFAHRSLWWLDSIRNPNYG